MSDPADSGDGAELQVTDLRSGTARPDAAESLTAAARVDHPSTTPPPNTESDGHPVNARVDRPSTTPPPDTVNDGHAVSERVDRPSTTPPSDEPSDGHSVNTQGDPPPSALPSSPASDGDSVSERVDRPSTTPPSDEASDGHSVNAQGDPPPSALPSSPVSEGYSVATPPASTVRAARPPRGTRRDRYVTRLSALAERGYACVALDRPTDPVNVGHALRAAFCYGARLVILGGDTLPGALGKLVTDPMRTFRHVPIIRADAVLDAVPEGCELVSVELSDDAVPLMEFKHPERACYVFGPENGSLSEEILRRSQHRVTIPTNASLNLGMTVNTVLYDRLAKSWEKLERRRRLRRRDDAEGAGASAGSDTLATTDQTTGSDDGAGPGASAGSDTLAATDQTTGSDDGASPGASAGSDTLAATDQTTGSDDGASPGAPAPASDVDSSACEVASPTDDVASAEPRAPLA